MSTPDLRRRGGWLPQQQRDLEAWLTALDDRVQEREPDLTLHPAVQAFADAIDRDPMVRLLMSRMIEQKPLSKPYTHRHLRDLPHLLAMVDTVLTMAPEWSSDSAVVLPLNAVLDWTMDTPAGFAAYRHPVVNEHLRRILGVWREFLDGPDSRYVLNDGPYGWRSPAAREAVGIEQFEHDPDDAYWGFSSWNDFFTRHFREGQRPVAAPEDPTVVANACESTAYRVATNVHRRDRFWAKGQPYSLHDMLAADPSVEAFVGGTVYQAFLSATNYHRWHSPVSGTIVRAFVEPGTYFSEADSEGPDAVDPQDSQAYLAHVATRAVVILEAEPPIGLLAFVAIGMSDVSTCIIDDAVTPGARIAKGDELGYFQFGGSTHCLVFRPGVVTDFVMGAIPQPESAGPQPLPVRAALATARLSQT